MHFEPRAVFDVQSSSCRRSNLPPHTAEAGRSDPEASHIPRTTLSHVASGQPDDADPSEAATSSAFSENRRASKDPGDASPVGAPDAEADPWFKVSEEEVKAAA